MIDNPYDAPSSVDYVADESRRPVGVTILSLLAGIIGLVLLGMFVVLVVNWREHNEFFVAQRMAPSLFWLFSGSYAVMALVASIGMWRGAKWGWWIACYGLVSLLVDNVGRAAWANLSHGAPSVATFTSPDSLRCVVRGTVAALILAYWLRKRVRKYFHLEARSSIKAIAMVTALFIGITTTVTVVLQLIFLYRTG